MMVTPKYKTLHGQLEILSVFFRTILYRKLLSKLLNLRADPIFTYSLVDVIILLRERLVFFWDEVLT